VRRRVAILSIALAAWPLGACGSSSPPTQRDLAVRDAERFLGRYTDPNGRVVRRDQGGDTVSEGQAYAMLLAVAVGDRAQFDRVWGWTQRNLERDDGLLSWHWQHGQVDDDQPAADADLDAAYALELASHRFKRPQLALQAAHIGQALRATETINTSEGGVLAAGPWATSRTLADPSYTDPAAIAMLAHLGDAASWQRLARASTKMVSVAADGGRALPPDWATVTPQAGATPTAAPNAPGAPAYSYDAARVPLAFAASCSPSDRALAAGLWPRLRKDPALLPRTLAGVPAPGARPSSVGLAGAAAAAEAAGRRAAARKLLDQASAQERQHPTYFGSALVALTRVRVMVPLLGRCR
jgi:endoglucanase